MKFQQMIEAGIFYAAPSFQDIIVDVRELESLINTIETATQTSTSVHEDTDSSDNDLPTIST